MQPRDKKVTNNQTAEAVVNTTESGTIGVIFAMLKGWITESSHYGLFPIAGALSLIRMVLVIRQAKLEQGKNKETIARAVMESVGALAMNTAVVFTFVGAAVASAAVLAVAAPIIFTATLGVKSLYSLVAAYHYLKKAVDETNRDKRNEYFQAAKENLIGFIAGSLVTAAVGLVLIAAQPVWSILGMVGAAIGFGFGGYTLYKAWDDRKAQKMVSAPNDPAIPKAEDERVEGGGPAPSPRLTNGAALRKTLSQSAAAQRPAEIPVAVASAAAMPKPASPVLITGAPAGGNAFLGKRRTFSTDSVRSDVGNVWSFSDFPASLCPGLYEDTRFPEQTMTRRSPG